MSEDLDPCSAALLLQKSFPDAALTSFISTSPSQAGSLSTSLRKMSARPGQAYACVIGTSRELQVRRWKNLVPGEGQMASHQPVTALKTLKPTLGFPSEAELPTSLHPPCPWQSTQPAMPCQPMSWERHCHGSTPSATCLLSLFIEHCWPSTGLRSQAPRFQSALREDDGRRAGLGRPPFLTPTSSLPKAWMLEQVQEPRW